MMRKIIAPKDDFYNRYIIRQELFKPVVDAFLNNGPRYNLLNSAMIEMFEFIKLVSLGDMKDCHPRCWFTLVNKKKTRTVDILQ